MSYKIDKLGNVKKLKDKKLGVLAQTKKELKALESKHEDMLIDAEELSTENMDLQVEIDELKILNDKGYNKEEKLLDLNNQTGPDCEPYDWKKDTRFVKTLTFLNGMWCGGKYDDCNVCERYMTIIMNAFNKIESLSGRTFVEFCDPECCEDVRGVNALDYNDLQEKGDRCYDRLDKRNDELLDECKELKARSIFNVMMSRLKNLSKYRLSLKKKEA